LTDGTTHPVASVGRGTLTIVDEGIFGPLGEAPARRFARRVFKFAEVRSVALDPSLSSATLAYHPVNNNPAGLVMRLADAVAGSGEELEDFALPRWPMGELVTLHRHGDIISFLDIMSSAHGRLLASHPTIRRDPAIARRVEDRLRVTPAVIEAVAISGKAELRVRFNPRAVTAGRLIRLVEGELLAAHNAQGARSAGPVDFAPANVSLGFAATGEFVLPIVTPVTAGMLVLANLDTFRVAARQAGEGKFGLPSLYTSIVAVTLATGQFLSAALMFWCFRYWEHRYRQDVETENRAFLEQAVSMPEEACALTFGGDEPLAPRRELAAGQRVRALAGEVVAADAHVLGGAALVDETALRGTPSPVRRVAGDQVFAGSKLIAGALDLEVVRSGDATQAARIAQALKGITASTPQNWALSPDGEEFAGRAVAPTFFAAAAGLVVGDLTTAGAILRPDYATGVGLAAPLETLCGVKLAMRNGAIVCRGDAFGRLATTSWILLEDNEALHDAQCDLAEISTHNLGESQLLLAAAAAGAWLGDERGLILADACRERGLIVRRAGLRETDAEGVVVDYRGHVVGLRWRPVNGAAAPPPLSVELDGVEVGRIRFRRNGRLKAARTVGSLQSGGLRVFLASERDEAAAARLALQLGVDRYCGGMRLDDEIRLLRALRKNGVSAVFVGDCAVGADAAREAHMSVALAGGDTLGNGLSDIVLLGSSIAPLPGLCALARDHRKRVERARHTVMAPNLLCVAGAFSFGWTGLAAVFLSNFGTSVVYNNAMRSLRTTRDSAAEWPGPPLVQELRAKSCEMGTVS
jgi:cation transport ATPase